MTKVTDRKGSSESMPLDLFDYKPCKPITSWDKQCSGLGMRLNRDGRKVYIVKYWLNSKQYQKTLCSADMATLDQARQIVLRVKTLARQGHDPMGLIADCLGVTDSQKLITMTEFSNLYMEKHAKLHKKSWKKDESLIARHILPRFAGRDISSIKRLELIAFHAEIGKSSQITANRVIELLHVMFKYAALWGFIPETTANQAGGIRMFRERARDRFVTPHEMPRLLEAISEHPDPVIRIALLLDLHLGLRSSELITLRWDYFDFEQKLLRLPDTKNGKAHVLPLTAEVEELIHLLPRYQANPFLFQGKGRYKLTHISRFDKAFRSIRHRAGLDDVRPHDLRRTAGSWINNRGASLHLIGRVLNQSTQQVTATYARFALDPVRDILSDHSRQIASMQQDKNDYPL